MRITDTVKHLIIINVLFFVATMLLSSRGVDIYSLLALHFPENDLFNFWQVITHMFMHSNTFFLHILFNMLALWMFGTPLEQMWGRNKFLFFYFSAGLGAVILPFVIDYVQFNSIISTLTDNNFDRREIITLLSEGKYYPQWIDVIGENKWVKLNNIFFQKGVGASGAVMGLLVAFGMTFPESKLMMIFLPIPIKAKYFIPILLAYEIISGLMGGSSMFGVNVAHFAHVGGAFFGFIMMWYWKKNQFQKNRWDL